jgi:hypothetical protein
MLETRPVLTLLIISGYDYVFWGWAVYLFLTHTGVSSSFVLACFIREGFIDSRSIITSVLSTDAYREAYFLATSFTVAL